MGEISREIGHRIRNFRKSRHMTLDELAEIVCKNKSTLSKYENGEIVLDIETIYEIARALGIHVEQLLYCMLVISANETCNILGETVAGSVDAE